MLKRGENEDSMTSVSTPTAAIETLADLLEQLAGIAPDRVGSVLPQARRQRRTCWRYPTVFTLPLQELFSELDLQGEG